ncbi:OmpA family protein [Flavobacterium sp. I3-2]|uniref:OmpA family protein n=1 Tax=Flavobacterium sp. I3-2 TaxID=2748319 RepID=UPI0015AD9AA6|nr:OmpA family protein [Flavobacterium sp. I3-2]
MIKKIILASLCVTLFSSCVTRRLYNELDAQLKDCTEERNRLLSESEALRNESLQLENSLNNSERMLAAAIVERDRLQIEYDQLAKSYKTLEKNSDAAIKAEIDRLNRLKSELNEKSTRVNELENKLAAQDANLKRLKDSLSKALYAFEGKGLTVEMKNGKVYVSMENKLLFNSGSWAVNKEGKIAVEELGKVLAQNPDISILIEGHTDNDRVIWNLGGGIESNWDLSTKRATTIVNILENNPNIDKKNLTAAGRSEFAPISSNATTEGKAKNRRIEVILTPKLDEISKMLNEI